MSAPRPRRQKNTATWPALPAINLQAAAYVALAAISSTVSQFALSPVYGSIPASFYHSQLLTAVLTLALTTALLLRTRHGWNLARWLPILAFCIPTLQSFLFEQSSRLGPAAGPVVTEACTIVPLVLLSIFAAPPVAHGESVPMYAPGKILPALGQLGIFVLAKALSPPVLHWARVLPCYPRSALSLVLASCYAVLSPSWLLVLVIPSLLHSVFFNVHMPFPHTTTLLNRALPDQSTYRLLSRADSLTGYLSVVESEEKELRLLRCDHSLLGGQWLRPPTAPTHTIAVHEPIYAAFAMLEAVRLVQVGKSADGHRQDAAAAPSALVIGLGVGTAASALVAHGVNTTIVEIDPIVHAYAVQYFGLPPNQTTVIEDAVTFTERAGRERRKYDFVIHDVFTGGAEPANLFTLEFIRGLRRLLKPNGVIAIVSLLSSLDHAGQAGSCESTVMASSPTSAVTSAVAVNAWLDANRAPWQNYAGDLLLPSAGLVIRTIQAVFPSCRIFRELQDRSEIGLGDFTNVVIFCIPTASPFSFRAPTAADFLGSAVREGFLLPQEEVDRKIFQRKRGETDVLTRATTSALDRWQRSSVTAHWRIMRLVLPDAVWELW
ncbi:MAG: hypothetical protein M1826_001053 [Phylliscum demangeonii]|nr:MAG: hypothetical protein M1826_001053 [Phylliscum demangeonii]